MGVGTVVVDLPGGFGYSIAPVLVPIIPGTTVASGVVSSGMGLTNGYYIGRGGGVTTTEVTGTAGADIETQGVFSSLGQHLPGAMSH